MDSKITKKQLKEALSVDVDRLLDDVVEAMNKAKPGSIIDDRDNFAACCLRRPVEHLGPGVQPGHRLQNQTIKRPANTATKTRTPKFEAIFP